jgi:hypothetical protein
LFDAQYEEGYEKRRKGRKRKRKRKWNKKQEAFTVSSHSTTFEAPVLIQYMLCIFPSLSCRGIPVIIPNDSKLK